MPRKQNGFGQTKSYAFDKVNGTIKQGKKSSKAAGYYPSDRSFGSTVHRSVIEKYNLDSDWVKWRKGFEYYNKAAWYELEEYNSVSNTYSQQKIDSKLYQGTAYEVDVEFTGYRFATSNADSSNHYVMKRTPKSEPLIGNITSIQNDPFVYTEKKAFREIWCQINTGADYKLLYQMTGERITDTVTTATLKKVLTSAGRPGVYKGKSTEETGTIITSRVPLASVQASAYIQANNGDVQSLVNKICYVPEFYIEKNLSSVGTSNFKDQEEFFVTEIEDTNLNVGLQILDVTTELPPSLYDIATLSPIYQTSTADVSLESSYMFKKSEYQRYYGKQYMTADLVRSEVTDIAYSILPFIINSVRIDGADLIIKSVAFRSELKLFADIQNGFLIFSDNSFTNEQDDYYDGSYFHTLGDPNDPIWKRIETNIDPWMDEVFTSSNNLRPAITYACSCPNFASAQLRMPQSTQSADERQTNRQERYPLPSALSPSTYDKQGQIGAAGFMQSWETEERKLGFKMCKHTIAAMFIDKLKIVEPNSYPTIDSRIQFEEKLEKEINEVAARFVDSYKRSGITTLELVFALSQGLNLDDVETAMVILGSSY
tara:strand:+ start:25231 stop:27027 length:1797 start_codon:yes stop_codon:yes gene_type:complete